MGRILLLSIFILKNDRNGIYCAALKAFGIEKKASVSELGYNNDSKDSTFNAIDLNNTITSESLKTFKLIISEEKWAQIKPTRQTYGRDKRKYISLQPGKWTHVFADKIWQQIKLPCAFAFKHVKVYINRC